MYKLTKEQLLFDLYVAFEYACKHKNNKKYVQAYKKDLYNNLIELRDVLFHRMYISNESLRRIKKKIYDIDYLNIKLTNPVQTINSYLGIFSHYKSLNIRKQIFDNITSIKKYGYFNETYTKFIPYNK